MDVIFMQAIKEWTDKNDIQAIIEFNFQTCQWLFKFYKRCSEGVREWKYVVPESYLGNVFEPQRGFSVMSMLAEAEEKFGLVEKENDNE